MDIVMELLSMNLGLRDLSVSGDFEYLEPVGASVSDSRSRYFFSWIQQPTLEYLSVDFHNTGQNQHTRAWIIKRASIEKAAVESKTAETMTAPKIEFESEYEPLPDLDCLQHLSVKNITLITSSFLPFLKRCKNLTAMDVYETQIRSSWSIVPAICTRLIKFLWEETDPSEEYVWGLLVDLQRCWRSLTFRSPYLRFDSESQRLLMTHAVNITCLEVRRAYGFKSVYIQRFLESATSLEEFRVSVPPYLNHPQSRIRLQDLYEDPAAIDDSEAHSAIEPEEGELSGLDDEQEDNDDDISYIGQVAEVHEIVDAEEEEEEEESDDEDEQYEVNEGDEQEIIPWTCAATLRVLELSFGGLPRANLKNKGKRVKLSEQEIKIQSRAYHQLGSLTSLENLYVGTYEGHNKEFAVREGGLHVQHNCLSFSLESGLALLAGMKNMRVLDVRGTDHDIGMEEVAWFRREWPWLERIDGLMESRRWVMRGSTDEKAKLKRYLSEHRWGIGWQTEKRRKTRENLGFSEKIHNKE